MIHPFQPIYSKESKILILGTMPSIKSRENNFYYGHPQNRFWKLLFEIFEVTPCTSIEGKIDLLHEKQIALWDVVKSCDIKGSNDSSIKNVIPNDIKELVEKANIKVIFTNGKKAYELYKRYCSKENQFIPFFYLPSTSPANQANYPFPILKEHWLCVKNYLS